MLIYSSAVRGLGSFNNYPKNVIRVHEKKNYLLGDGFICYEKVATVYGKCGAETRSSKIATPTAVGLWAW